MLIRWWYSGTVVEGVDSRYTVTVVYSPRALPTHSTVLLLPDHCCYVPTTLLFDTIIAVLTFHSLLPLRCYSLHSIVDIPVVVPVFIVVTYGGILICCCSGGDYC